VRCLCQSDRIEGMGPFDLRERQTCMEMAGARTRRQSRCARALPLPKRPDRRDRPLRSERADRLHGNSGSAGAAAKGAAHVRYLCQSDRIEGMGPFDLKERLACMEMAGVRARRQKALRTCAASVKATGSKGWPLRSEGAADLNGNGGSAGAAARLLRTCVAPVKASGSKGWAPSI